jgi:CRP-like cAMP-binding protein
MENIKTDEERKMKENMLDTLANFSFFRGLNEDELKIISKKINVVKIQKDEILFKEGDKGDCVYFIVDGQIDVLKESVSGSKIGIDKVLITTLTRGRSIGEMSIIDKIPRSATVKARTKTKLITLTLSDFDLICEGYPKIGLKIIKEISRLLSMNMRKTSSRLADYMLAIS